MFVFQDALKFFRDVISISFKTNYASNRATLVDWKATKYEGKTLEFLANFTYPEDISNYADPDELKLTIENPEVFISSENGLSLAGQLSFKLHIKPLLEPPAGSGTILGTG